MTMIESSRPAWVTDPWICPWVSPVSVRYAFSAIVNLRRQTYRNPLTGVRSGHLSTFVVSGHCVPDAPAQRGAAAM
jgi:hypothetical protein